MSKNFYLYSVFILFILTAGVFAKDSPKDLYLKGKESHFNGKYEEAIFYFKESLSLNPNYAEPLLELAKIYDELELYDYSYDYLTKAAFLTNNTDMTIYLADIETKLGRYDTAEKKYKDILSRNPLEIRASNGLANIYLRTNRKILAKKSLDEILKKDHKNFSALSKLAEYYEDIDLNKAESYYVANVENNSLNPDSYLEYSIFCFNNGMIIKAIDNVKTAVTISDKSIYKKYYAKYLLFMNRGDEALKLFKEILKNEGEVNYLSYYHLAYCYYLLSDFDNAKLSIKRATGLRGDDETSQYFLNY
ncbi:MAG TPA: tetratricopeptide repeat protein, partial [Spirochaetota bacterium]|nr:tetratricopeptide repeat protein [Spirochaetota bacterium]